MSTATATPTLAPMNGSEPPVCHDFKAIGGPTPSAWREAALTRAMELEAQFAWLYQRGPKESPELRQAVSHHLRAAREAAEHNQRLPLFPRSGPLLERAIGNLGAVEADMLQVAPQDYLFGQIPSALNHVQRHLSPDDPRRQEMECIAREAGVCGREPSAVGLGQPRSFEERVNLVALERRMIVSAVRAASSAALREQLRVRSFRNTLVATTAAMALLAFGIGLMGILSPSSIPLCFQPERAGQTVVVCPTAQSDVVPARQSSGPASTDVDAAMRRTAGRRDLFVVELIGLAAASVAAAAAVRNLRGSSEPHGLPIALAVLKLPTGALTSTLGLLLMRGQFVPGLSALDTSAQILAWALVFGYAQQLFTRLIDKQANVVLENVRGAGQPGKTGTAAQVVPTS